MSAFNRLRKNQVLEPTNTTVTTVTTVAAENDSSVVKVVTVGVVNAQTSKIEDNQPTPGIDPRAAALATGTTWRPPGNPFFIRDHIYNASMDETYDGYWLVVWYVGSGHTPERAMRYAVARIIREWDSRKPGRPRPMIAGKAS